MNKGKAIGGPVDGQTLSSKCRRLTIPFLEGYIQEHYELSPGVIHPAMKPVFGAAVYNWDGQAWRYNS